MNDNSTSGGIGFSSLLQRPSVIKDTTIKALTELYGQLTIQMIPHMLDNGRLILMGNKLIISVEYHHRLMIDFDAAISETMTVINISDEEIRMNRLSFDYTYFGMPREEAIDIWHDIFFPKQTIKP